MPMPIVSTSTEGKPPRKPGKLIRCGICSAIFIACSIIVIVAAVVSKHNQSKKIPSPAGLDVLVSTECGTLGGRMTMTANHTKVYEFVNIPYAFPPINNRRWKRPELLRSDCWTGTYTSYKVSQKMCPQLAPSNMAVIGQEDCLYLSVRTPNISGKLPVLVWIHGGGLLMGYNDAEGYSSDADFTAAMGMVTVNINYRLGLLGFLSLKELWDVKNGAYGNYGLLDQIAALQWIKLNIAKFGGDPNSVTIFGQSSGGSSVLALVASPIATGLFHRAISFSGPIPKTDYSTVASVNRDYYLSQIGCGPCTAEEMRKCLTSAPLAKIVNGSYSSMMSMLGPSGFPVPGEIESKFPYIDPVVFPRPLSSLNASATRIPVLISTMAQEIGLFPKYRFKDSEWDKMWAVLRDALSRFNSSLADPAFALYANQSSANDSLVVPQEVYETMVTDVRWTCAANTLAEAVGSSTNRSAYRLYINHRPGNQSTARFSYRTWDMYALFGKYKGVSFTPHDMNLQSMLRSTIKHFASNGTLPMDWHFYPHITAVFTNASPWVKYMQGSVQKEQCAFWDANASEMKLRGALA